LSRRDKHRDADRMTPEQMVALRQKFVAQLEVLAAVVARAHRQQYSLEVRHMLVDMGLLVAGQAPQNMRDPKPL
jgi:hypothetical protein